MAATIGRGKTFTNTEQVTNTKLHTLVDSATITGIVNAEIAAAAAIAYTKLSLTGGIVNADINASAGIVGSKLDLTSPGAIGSTAAGTGAFSTLKVGTTNQGDILYDNATSLVRLTPGTAGNTLKSGGAAANPSWAALNLAGGAAYITGALPIANGGTGTTGDNIIKGWINFNGTGTIAINDSYNVASITDNGVGNYTITWDTDFANVGYAIAGYAAKVGVYIFITCNVDAPLTVGLADIEVVNNAAIHTDSPVTCIIAIGGQ